MLETKRVEHLDPAPPARPRRILQVVRRIDAGGIAIWLMNVLRQTDTSRYQMDFMTVGGDPRGPNVAQIQSAGGKVLECAGYHRPWIFARNFARIMRDYGPYDIVHSHVYNYSGLVLKLAARHGVPIRIAQSHSDYRLENEDMGGLERLARRAYLGLTKGWIDRHATLGIGVSRRAAAALFGERWNGHPNRRIVRLGIDLAPFAVPWDRAVVRRALDLSADSMVIGHVGNRVWAKNHEFMIEVAAEVVAKEPLAKLLLIGHGLSDPNLAHQIRTLGLSGRVHILGPRDDVPRLMLGAMDLFLFPSHYEGLGLALIEAQAAGLPCVVSTGVPEEADVIPELIQRLPVSAPPAAWAAAVLEGAARRSVAQSEAYRRLLQSDYNIENSVATLMEIYGGAAVRRMSDVAH
jgi:glycosyltransferase involved in cell wall biosynthesis